MTRVQSLSAVTLYKLCMRAYFRIESLMTDPANGYQPFGWDWPTAWVLHPNLVRMYRRVKCEFHRRAAAEGMSINEYRRAYVHDRHLITGRRRRARRLPLAIERMLVASGDLAPVGRCRLPR